MKQITHSLKFVTELDETNWTAIQFLELSETEQIKMLESMLKDILAPEIQPIVDKINAGNTWAELKMVQ